MREGEPPPLGLWSSPWPSRQRQPGQRPQRWRGCPRRCHAPPSSSFPPPTPPLPSALPPALPWAPSPSQDQLGQEKGLKPYSLASFLDPNHHARGSPIGSPSLFSDSFSLSPSFPFSSSFLGASLVFSFASSSIAPTPSRGSWSPRKGGSIRALVCTQRAQTRN